MKRRSKKDRRPPCRKILEVALALALLAPPPGLATPVPAEGGADDSAEVVIHPAAPPSALELARMARWLLAWREEALAFTPAFTAALEAVPSPDRTLRARCPALAEAILAIDRARVLPVPDRTADLHLRRGLRAVTLAAVACLRDRPYAARGRLREARDAFLRAERRLRRYRCAID